MRGGLFSRVSTLQLLQDRGKTELLQGRSKIKRGELYVVDTCYYTLFTERGGQGPPLTFQRGGPFEKRGGQIFFVRPLPQKLILHHIDTFVMQVSWIGSKQSNEIIIFIITTMIFYSMIYVILMIEKHEIT